MMSNYWIIFHNMNGSTCPTWVVALIALALVGFIGYFVYDVIQFNKK